ncbi:MAG: TatD family deoxyribonuclease [Calditrichaeota bacterium]|nr:MAG: TatD family deoxyribonuclease [Calditrichota bacterium]
MPPFLIDTHTHLDFDRYDNDRDEVIRRAAEAFVAGMLTIGVDYPSSLAAVRLAEEYEQIYAAVGVHPHDANAMDDEQFENLCRLLEHPQVVAVGEVGLDYHYDYSPRDVQRRVFRRFLDVAWEMQKPLIIHTREADEDMFSILREKSRSGWRGVFHCFSSDEAAARKVLDFGFHISFTGNITFKNSRSVPVMKNVPIEKMLVETDCPFMAPEPYRGRRNEPAYVVHVAGKIAKEKELSFDTVAQITTQNAIRLFNLPL